MLLLVLVLGFVVLPVVLAADRSRPAWRAFLPALGAALIAVYHDATEPPGYDMPGFGLRFYLLVAVVAAACALAGLVVRRRRS